MQEKPTSTNVPAVPPELVAPENLLQSTKQNTPIDALARGVSPSPSQNDGQAQCEFLWGVHNYTNQYIRFADTKAGFCVAIVLALFGALVSAGTHELFLHVARVQWALLAWASLVAFLLLIVAVLAAVAAVRPRLWTHSSRGFIFWESVAAYESPDRFSDAFRTQLDNDLKDHLAHHLYTLAKVCRRKYLWVNWAIFTGATGGVLGLIVLFFQRSRS